MTADSPRALLRRLSSREGMANPHPIFEALREAAPLHDAPCFGPALTRYADVRETLFDRSLHVSAQAAKSGSARARIGERMPEDLRRLPPWLFLMDEPDHSRLRKVMAPIFAQSAIDALRPQIAANVETILGAVHRQAHFDLVDAFAIPLPLFVISDVLGIEPDERHALREWSEALVYKLHALASPQRYDEAVAAHRALADFFRARIRQRHTHAKSDVLTYLAATERRGDINEDEAVSLAVNLLVAGHLTTSDLIASTCLLVMRNPCIRARLARDPSLWAKAVDESLRLEPPTPLLARVYGCPAHVHGRDLEAGDTLNVFIAAANRDPEVFSNPNEMKLDRRSGRHLSFGGGGHFCLGAPLARAEAEIACRLLFETLPELELDDGELEWRPNPNFRGLTRMPVRCVQPAAPTPSRKAMLESA